MLLVFLPNLSIRMRAIHLAPRCRATFDSEIFFLAIARVGELLMLHTKYFFHSHLLFAPNVGCVGVSFIFIKRNDGAIEEDSFPLSLGFSQQQTVSAAIKVVEAGSFFGNSSIEGKKWKPPTELQRTLNGEISLLSVGYNPLDCATKKTHKIISTAHNKQLLWSRNPRKWRQ